MIDASRIAPKLYQGSKPTPGYALDRAGFHAVVLCAMEYQLGRGSFGPTDIICCPLDDAAIDDYTIETARLAAKHVVAQVQRGRRVLVTCQQGRNRSGLVTALALRKLLGCSGREAVARIQARRRNALTNESFAGWLKRLPALTSSSAAKAI